MPRQQSVDALGYINRKKVAVGGHSYGAFMTANLLTHSNLFCMRNRSKWNLQ
jgi:dipeptidyl aminopeptidase/acylaminoacyl peptidase